MAQAGLAVATHVSLRLLTSLPVAILAWPPWLRLTCRPCSAAAFSVERLARLLLERLSPDAAAAATGAAAAIAATAATAASKSSLMRPLSVPVSVPAVASEPVSALSLCVLPDAAAAGGPSRSACCTSEALMPAAGAAPSE